MEGVQPPIADQLGLARQAPPLLIREFQPLVALLLFLYIDLLLQVFDHMLLLAVHPARKQHQDQLEGVHCAIPALFCPVKRTESEFLIHL
jgi:hypothetical protein